MSDAPSRKGGKTSNRRRVMVQNHGVSNSDTATSGNFGVVTGWAHPVSVGGSEQAHILPIPYSTHSGPYYARAHWWQPAAGTGLVTFQFGLASMSDLDSGVLTNTTTDVADSCAVIDTYHVTAWTAALTVTNTEAPGDVLILTVGRDETADAGSIDILAIGFEVEYTGV
ncbi:MAG TPA: hypothetical protein VM537_10325 [Anaerolineae bacterium]|nr:hypothetical protein [Anaerolineae bacterium]